MAKKKNDIAWLEAKKQCRLNEADIRMAKELGMSPKSLIKNIPAPNQKWKTPVKVWIRDLYEGKFGRVLTVKPALNNEENRKLTKEEKPMKDDVFKDEDLPF
ncbi:hypothetical protein [Bacillus sp. AFS040349]|uniref:hypothetical protein n=1 Tax=Bacillus sp. AFS040349 TaxID=2033502 RepID=UPI000BFC9B21|nr:hypothetical protein [Bacillus sp. AFS040349]PGT82454.1 hypothetical protein COD11_14860 [Bacillus sp. AFS040349]